MKTLILLSFLTVTYWFSAQVVNIENSRIYDDTLGWSGAVDASFSFIQNKETFFSLNSKARIQYKTKKHYFFVLSDFMYSGGKEVYANSGMGHMRYAYRIKNGPWKWESFAQVQYNQLLNQRIRVVGGTGLRWKFLSKEKSKGFIGTSVMYEYEEIQPNNEFNSDFRMSNYVSWFLEKGAFSFSGTTYYQPLYADFKDYRFSGQYSFSTKIAKKLRFKTDVSAFYDSKPPTTVRDWMLSLMVGFGWDFGK